jgi:hypothetical protein
VSSIQSEHAAVVDAHGRTLESEGVDRVEGRDDELGLGAPVASPMMSMSHCTNWR